MALTLKRRRTKFTFETYCDAIDRCLNGIDAAHQAYRNATSFKESNEACDDLVYWSKLNVRIVVRRNREHLGM